MGNQDIAVLMGGWGEEREISMETGEAVAVALEQRGHCVQRLVADDELDVTLRRMRPKVAFLALHGRMGEDGKVQGLLEVMRIPYTGSGVLASALAMNKVAAKKLFRQHNLATPVGYSVGVEQLSQADGLHCDLGYPCIVKPALGGSSLGLSVVHAPAALRPALVEACRYGGVALVERFVQGREVTVAVLDGEVLGSCEVSHGGHVFDHHAKYGTASDYHLPPRLSPTRLANIEMMALTAYRSLGCRGAARVDFISAELANDVLLELNTVPGLTPTSLLPKIAAARGYSFGALCERVLESAWLENVDVRPAKVDSPLLALASL